MPQNSHNTKKGVLFLVKLCNCSAFLLKNNSIADVVLFYSFIYLMLTIHQYYFYINNTTHNKTFCLRKTKDLSIFTA